MVSVYQTDRIQGCSAARSESPVAVRESSALELPTIPAQQPVTMEAKINEMIVRSVTPIFPLTTRGPIQGHHTANRPTRLRRPSGYL